MNALPARLTSPSPVFACAARLLLLLVWPIVTYAQDARSSGMITGRVFNPSTGQYVYRAEIVVEGSPGITYTETDGSYSIAHVPAGQATINVTYTGYQTARATVTVPAGGSAVQNFNLSRGAEPTARGDEAIQLDKFTVEAAREGNAKAIMEERTAMNFKNVLSADSFGENADGNVGEFLKLMPGISIDYAFIQARGMRVAGLAPKYSSMTMDGNSVATGASASFDADTRGIELDAVSFVGIESVEINKTLTADMQADAAAGNVNLRSKNAFDREGRRITFKTSATANSFAPSLRPTPGPWGDEMTVKVRPNFLLGYSDVLLNKRLGVEATLSYNNRWNTRDYQTELYDYTALAASGPRIRRLQFASNSAFSTAKVIGLNLDFKASDDLTLSWRSTFSARSLPGRKRQWNLQTATKDLLPGSNLTSIITKADGTNTFLQEGGQVANEKYTDTLVLSPRFKYRLARATLTGGFDLSDASATYTDLTDGMFTIAVTQLASMSWSAQRTNPESTDWVVTQTSGRPWGQPGSYDLDGVPAGNIGSRADRGVQLKMAGRLDLTVPIYLRVPVTLKTGGFVQEMSYKLTGVGAKNWSYIGSGTSQTSPLAQMPMEPLDTYMGYMSKQVWGQRWPQPDRRALYQIYTQHPGYFVEDTLNNFTQALTFPRLIREQVDAAYLRADSDIGAWQLQGGLRFERTRTTSHLLEQIPAAKIARDRPDLKPNTIPYVFYQYNSGVQTIRSGEYQNLFASGGAKYKFNHNFDWQLSASEAITRPDYNNLAGAISVADSTQIVTVPNPNLKPELSTKYYTGINYYFEPAGKLSLGTYYLDFKHLQIPGGQTLSQADAGYAGYPEYNGYTFLTTTNAPGSNQNRGIELEYVQQLVFLPGILKGLSIYGSMSRVIADSERIGVVNKFASGGLAFRYRRFDARFNATWQGPMMTSKSGVLNKYNAERTAADLEFGYKLNQSTRIYVAGRNIADSPFKTYERNGDYGQLLISSVARYGSYWTLGVNCEF